MSHLDVTGLSKRFGPASVFDDIHFSLAEGELVTLLGPSGCGKSTLLRCIAGLTPADTGSLRLDGVDITGLAPQRRGIGMVFQHYALFPNLTVAGNVGFGLKMQRVPAVEAARRVDDMLALVELDGLRHQAVHRLSGGQRQRVALARALVVRPRLLLLDEPLSALDARIRKSLQEEIRRVQTALKLTTLFVTHDQEEALLLSDRIFVMDGGRIVQQGTAEDIYTRPATSFVARFIGSYNLLAPAQALHLFGLAIDGQLALRPESITLQAPGQGGAAGLVARPGVVQRHQLLGSVLRYHVDVGPCVLMVDVLNRGPATLLAPGSAVRLLFDPAQLHALPA